MPHPLRGRARWRRPALHRAGQPGNSSADVNRECLRFVSDHLDFARVQAAPAGIPMPSRGPRVSPRRSGSHEPAHRRPRRIHLRSHDLAPAVLRGPLTVAWCSPTTPTTRCRRFPSPVLEPTMSVKTPLQAPFGLRCFAKSGQESRISVTTGRRRPTRARDPSRELDKPSAWEPARPSQRACSSRGQIGNSVLWRTSVGTWTAGTTKRTSISIPGA